MTSRLSSVLREALIRFSHCLLAIGTLEAANGKVTSGHLRNYGSRSLAVVDWHTHPDHSSYLELRRALPRIVGCSIVIAMRQHVVIVLGYSPARGDAPVSSRSRSRRFASSRRRRRILSAHSGAAFSPSTRAHVRLAFALLLIRITAGFLAFGFREIALVLAFAFVFRGAGLLKRDSNGLTAAFDLSGLAPWTALQLAMFELMHDSTHGPALSG